MLPTLQADGIFRQMLSLADRADISASDLKKSAKWKKVEPLVKSFLGNSLHLLGERRDRVSTSSMPLPALQGAVQLKLSLSVSLSRLLQQQCDTVWGLLRRCSSTSLH